MLRTVAAAVAADDPGVPPIRTTIGFAIILIAALLAIAVAGTPTEPHHGQPTPARATH